MPTPTPLPNAGCDPGAGGISLGDCLQLSDSTHVADKYSSLSFLVNLLVRNLFVLAGIALFVMVLLAGFQYLTKGEKGIEEAKKIATASLLGFIIMFTAYWVVQLIQYVTGANIIL